MDDSVLSSGYQIEPNNGPFYHKRISMRLDLKGRTRQPSSRRILSRYANNEHLQNPTAKNDDLDYIEYVESSIINEKLESLAFPHPALLIGILEDSWSMPEFSFNQELLSHVQLYMNGIKKDLLSEIAKIYEMETDEFLRVIGSNLLEKGCLESWRELFPKDQIECADEIARVAKQMQKQWSLCSMLDLFSLHSLAYFLNTRIYLILARHQIPDSNPGLFTQPLGPKDYHHSLYIVLFDQSSFSIAEPQYYLSKRNHVSFDPKSSISRFCSITNDKLYYLNFMKLFSQFSQLNSSEISVCVINRKNQETPSISLSKDLLEITIDYSDDISLFRNFADSICTKVYIIDQKSSQNSALEIQNGFVSGNVVSPLFVSEQNQQISLNEGNGVSIGTMKELMLLKDYFSQNHIGASNNSKDIWSRSCLDENIFLQYQKELSIILPFYDLRKIQNYLSSYKDSPYAELLAMRAMLKTVLGETNTMFCCLCHKKFEPNKLKIPYRSKKSEHTKLLPICTSCCKKSLNDVMRETIFKEFNMFNDLNRDIIQKHYDMIDNNINFLENNPIGYLHDSITMIKSMFSTFCTISSLDFNASIAHTYYGCPLFNVDEAKLLLKNSYSVDYLLDPQEFKEYLSKQEIPIINNKFFYLKCSSNEVLSRLDEIYGTFIENKFLNQNVIEQFDIKIDPSQILSVRFDTNTKPELNEKHYFVKPIFHDGFSFSSLSSFVSPYKMIDIYYVFGEYLLALFQSSMFPDDTFTIYVYLFRIGVPSIYGLHPIFTISNVTSIKSSSFDFKCNVLVINGEMIEQGFLYVQKFDSNGKLVNGFIQYENHIESVVSDSYLYLLRSTSDNLLPYNLEVYDYDFCKNCIVLNRSISIAEDCYETPPYLLTNGYDLFIFNGNDLKTVIIEEDDVVIMESVEFSVLHNSIIPIESHSLLYPRMVENNLIVIPKNEKNDFSLSFQDIPSFNGIFPSTNVNDSNNTDLFAYAFVECFPVLCAISWKKQFYIIDNDLSYFYPNHDKGYIKDSIIAFYYSIMKRISLHHVGELVSNFSLDVKFFTFVSFGNINIVASYIDQVFGIRMSSVKVSGIWIGIRVVSKTAYIILLVNDNGNHSCQEVIEECIKASQTANSPLLICLDKYSQAEHMAQFISSNELFNNRLSFHVFSSYPNQLLKENAFLQGIPVFCIPFSQINFSKESDLLRFWNKNVNDMENLYDYTQGIHKIHQLISNLITIREFRSIPKMTIMAIMNKFCK